MTNLSDEKSDALGTEIERAKALLENDPGSAANRLRGIIPHSADAPEHLRLLAAALRRLGRVAEAERAEADSAEASARLPELVEAARAINAGRLQQAERSVRGRLESDPEDAEALRLLAEIRMRAGHPAEAEALLGKVLKLAPAFTRARVNLATLLHDQKRTGEALAQFEEALVRDPECIPAMSLRAATLLEARRMDDALKAYEALVARAPHASVVWMNYGYVLKTIGRLEEAVAAYRKSLAIDPGNGFAWLGLANLKTVQLASEDVETMQSALNFSRGDLNLLQLHFALGKGLADIGRYEDSFRHYESANSIRGRLMPFDLNQLGAAVAKAEAMVTAPFLEARRIREWPSPVPIFIVGMPRSGSTLVEQILASHPLVEAADELPALDEIVTAFGGRGLSWLDRIAGAGTDELRHLGEEYLRAAARYRRTDRPFFTDKMPYNWRHLGLIRLILPQARIIEVRREPIACCFANFTQYFTHGAAIPSGLESLAAYYRTYVRMMDHFEQHLPGWIHRVAYEDLVQDPEAEIRRLLHCHGLDFDEACLRFYENGRAVLTPSAQQVRQPIDASRLDFWRNFEPCLGPLRQALGAAPAG